MFPGIDIGLDFAATYLGIEVAIKEVLPSNDYDVAKYFEREWRLMKCVTFYSFPAVYLLLQNPSI